MTSQRGNRIVLVLVAAGALGLWAYVGLRTSPVRPGDTAPPFRAVTLDTPAAERTLADYAGHVVLLNIWATWCEPCIVEMPTLEALHRRFAGQGLRVVAVSVDAPGSAAAIREFRDRLGLTFDVLHDAGNIQATYQTAGVPESFVIARDGRIRKRVFSADDWDSPANRALVAQLLGIPEHTADSLAAP